MKITCPGCQKRIPVFENEDRDLTHGTFRMECSVCMVSLKISVDADFADKELPVQEEVSHESNQILIAVDGEATRELIRSALQDAGYKILEALNGHEALSLVERNRPALALLDVGLPEKYGFEVCDEIKRNDSLKSIKVILVAAIYNNSSYRREPKTLYGAEDYIERHHLQNQLLDKVRTLLGPSPSESLDTEKSESGVRSSSRKEPDDADSFPNEEGVSEEQEHTVMQLSPNEEPMSAMTEAAIDSPSLSNEGGSQGELVQTMIETPSHDESKMPDARVASQAADSPEHDAAKRLARIIVSDIALYNSDRVQEARQKNNFYELLKTEIEEGRRLYNERIAEGVRTQADYYQQTLENYIQNGKI